MANVSAPSGLSPVQNGDGSPWNQQVSTYFIPQADGSAYYIGDIVKSLAGFDAATLAPHAIKAVAGDAARGVIVGIEVDPDNLGRIFAPATKTRSYRIYVVDDPNVIFEMMDDGITGANLVTTAVGKNANFTVAAPSGVVPTSATVINSSTIATTADLPLKIIGLKRVAGNTAAAFARWLVRFNKHEFIGTTAGV